MILWLTVALAWDLDEVRTRATDAALAVERADAERAVTAADAWQVTSGSLPSVTGFASVSTGRGFTSFGFERPVQTQTGIGARGSWVLLAPSRWAAAVSARQGLAGRRAMLDWARVDARREATTRYAGTWASQQELTARERAVADATAASEAVAAMVEAGLRPRADAARARAEALTAQAELDTARWRATAACAELRALLREDPDGDCVLEPPVWAEPVDGPGAHPALEAARAALASAKASTGSAATGLVPTITANGTGAWYATDAGVGGFGWSAGAEATMPLVGSGAGWAEVAGSRAEARVAALDLEDQERTLRIALATATARHRAAGTALQARQSAGEASEEALSLVTERYRAGTAGLTEWMDARRARDAAAVALAGAQAELGAALAELEAARGVW